MKHEGEQPIKVPAKRGRKPKPGSISKSSYFGEREEQAIKLYISGTLPQIESDKLFKTIINPCLEKLVDGILTMPKFQKVIGISREQLREDAYFHLFFQMKKYDPNRIGKTGELAKAYSYFGTVVKNYILGIKISNDGNIANYGGTLDVDEIGDHIPDLRRDPLGFEKVREELLVMLEKAIEAKRLNKNDLIVGNTLKYMVLNWHKLEFKSKNEFIRLLGLYTQLSPSVVARSLKKYKLVIHDTLPEEPKPKEKRQPKPVVTLASVITEAFNMTNLGEAKRLVCSHVEKSNMKEFDKQNFFLEVGLKSTLYEFHTYITNFLLERENLSDN